MSPSHEIDSDTGARSSAAQPVVVVGAGSVGLTLGARLAARRRDVVFVVRRAEQAVALNERGVSLEQLDGEPLRGRVRAFVGCAAARHLEPGWVVVCVQAGHTEILAPQIADAWPAATVVSAQNHVTNEAVLARHSRSVLGLVWRQTVTRLSDIEVRSGGAAQVIVGSYPDGLSPAALELAAVLRDAGFDAGLSPTIARDKWLKLCVNLMSIPNALIHPRDHTSAAFAEGKARLLEEARAVLAAAGIEAASGDGRARSLEQEIEWQRLSAARGLSARRAPLYNQVWRAFEQRARGLGPDEALEADTYHELITRLGAAHGVATPLNERVLAHTRRAWHERAAAESCGVAEMFGIASSE
ncbi:ketopantoate reductase family protein [Sorangium cellulosum]|uniref:ketopantoate reductase family protein n=1 Tax=Sorangium cellulosum TaxID=56 RepID=UPI003D9A8801